MPPMTAPVSFNQPYPSRRGPLMAGNVVATSQPLAAQAGLEMLRRGGTAVDAGIAAAMVLTVVEPTANGLGSDAFAIYWDGTRLHGLNASGRAPRAWTPARFAGRSAMPRAGWDSVTVPGAVSAWVALSDAFGRLPFATLAGPAIGYARDGFAVTPMIAHAWAEGAARLGDQPEFARTFLPDGRPPRPGERFRCPALADSLEAIATSRGDAFYRGALAERMVRAAAAAGGALSADDLADHQPSWCGTLAIDYRGVTLHEIPPNGQGIAALIGLGLLRHHDVTAHGPDGAAGIHLQIEAMKLAFADLYRTVADPAAMTVTPEALLDPAYLAERARLIDPDRAGTPAPGAPGSSDTVYLAAADGAGRMLSYIQSNFDGFGSGVVVPGTGISLQNRGAGFSLDPDHPNLVGPGKRPFHTILPGFLVEGTTPRLAFGVMGGQMQTQGHVQMVVRLVDHGQNPQAASDAPRWRVLPDGEVVVEPGLPPATVEGLQALGHRVSVRPLEAAFGFGGAQLVWRLDDGGYCCGSDHRKDGCAVGF